MPGIHRPFQLPSGDSNHFIKPRHGIFHLFFGVLAPTIRNSLLESSNLWSGSAHVLG